MLLSGRCVIAVLGSLVLISPGATKKGTAAQQVSAQGSVAAFTAPEPAYLDLFKLYMAANADVLGSDDAAAWEHFLLFSVPPGQTTPARTSPECLALYQQTANEITRQNLLADARARFKTALSQAQSWPKTAVFRLKTREALREYDEAAAVFPLAPLGGASVIPPSSRIAIGRNNPRNLPNAYQGPFVDWCARRPGLPGVTQFGLELSGNDRLRQLPMQRAAAETYLNSASKGGQYRTVTVETVIEVGPALIKPRPVSSSGPTIPARIIAARVLDLDGKVLHVFPSGAAGATQSSTSSGGSKPVAAPGQTAPPPGYTGSEPASMRSTGAPSTDAVPLNSYRATLLTVRDVPQVADANLVAPTYRQVVAEQRAWGFIANAASGAMAVGGKLNPKKSAFTYEWQAYADRQPDFANGALLDVFLRTDPDWSFVTQDPAWDTRFAAHVDVFMFSRDKVEGRDARFAAQELAPVYKRHLEAASRKAPTRLWLTIPLPKYGYDFNARALRFLPQGVVLPGPNPTFTNTIDILSPLTSRLVDWRLPARASATANYSLLGATQQMGRADPALTKLGINPNPPAATWREFFSIGSSDTTFPWVEVLALDRQLQLSAIPLDPARAEALVKSSTYVSTAAGLTARVYIDAERVELSEAIVDRKTRKNAVLFARLRQVDILDPSGSIATTLNIASLPPPAPSAVAAPATTKTPPSAATPAETMGERVVRMQREREEKMRACRERASKANPNVSTPEYLTAYRACMAER